MNLLATGVPVGVELGIGVESGGALAGLGVGVGVGFRPLLNLTSLKAELAAGSYCLNADSVATGGVTIGGLTGCTSVHFEAVGVTMVPSLSALSVYE